jgi:hypothetical protein
VSAARRKPALAGGLATLALALMVGPVLAAVSVVWERNLTSNLTGLSYPYNDAFEPIVATHPSDSQKLAVVYEYKPSKGAGCGMIPGLRTSTDGGTTWTTAARRPWSESGRLPNWHAAIAWGPGPAGKARLYWADTTLTDCSNPQHRLSIAYSDDRGASWSTMFVYKGVAATPYGGYPDITVDRDPNSPNYGAVYATINYYSTQQTEPGMRVLASYDYGAHWLSREVPPLAQTQANPFRYRLGYRLATAADGSLYASFCETDRPAWSGFPGRLAYGVSRLRLNKSQATFSAAAPVLATTLMVSGYNTTYDPAPGTTDRQRLNACGTNGLDVDHTTGRVYLAVAGYDPNPAAGVARGFIRLGRSDDLGQTWSWQRLADLPAVNGRTQSAHRPALVVNGSKVFVGFHVLTDVSLSTTGVDSNVTVGNAFTVSSNGGDTWTAPALISSSRWNPDWLDLNRQGAGLRDRAALTAAGRAFYAWGDGRNARAKPDSRWGRGQIYGALIDLGQ